MDSARQLIRWSLPGLVLVLNVLLVHGLWVSLIDHQRPWSFISAANAPALVAIVAGGLPGGFLLYQFYFHGYGPVGPARAARYALFFRRDRGASVLTRYLSKYGGERWLVDWVDTRSSSEHFDMRLGHPEYRHVLVLWLRLTDHLPSAQKHPAGVDPHRCPECIRLYKERWHQNWTLFQSVLDYCSANGNRSWIKQEYTSGSDLYHGLGASRTAVWLSAVAALLYSAALGPITGFERLAAMVADPANAAVFLVLICGLIGFELRILSRCRDQVSRVYEEKVAAALAVASREIDKPAGGGRSLDSA
ncbi:hypothetical protein ASF88_04305 [Leifsonia sp. Leaf336]|uniref:hypothetical protein n=1 Tax=Leifsonia sp. Leaf336 TaxID=1736341 RepID=UPI0007010ADF|nr:hypothetical protein [Leifsonia sp. Leaf336]KQR54064.1 hypothetical protein ASF88_04305 [Leifsonia sp. Leaf336]